MLLWLSFWARVTSWGLSWPRYRVSHFLFLPTLRQELGRRGRKISRRGGVPEVLFTSFLGTSVQNKAGLCPMLSQCLGMSEWQVTAWITHCGASGSWLCQTKIEVLWLILRSSQKASGLLRERTEASLRAKLAWEDAGAIRHPFTDLRVWGICSTQQPTGKQQDLHQ